MAGKPGRPKKTVEEVKSSGEPTALSEVKVENKYIADTAHDAPKYTGKIITVKATKTVFFNNKRFFADEILEVPESVCYKKDGSVSSCFEVIGG